MPIHNESKLVERLSGGDHEAFRELYDYYAPQLYRFVYSSLRNHEDGKEIVQNVFTKLWIIRSKVKVDTSFQSFLFTIARNLLFNFVKSKYYTSILSSYDVDELVDDSGALDFHRLDSELVDQVNELIKLLPEKRREIFLLNKFYGLTYREIADKLNISENTVDTQIRRSLSSLRSGMKGKSVSLLLLLCI